MDPKTSQGLKDFREELAGSAEYIVFHTLPNKILELQDLIHSTSTADSPFHRSHASKTTDTTVYPPPNIHESISSVEEPSLKKRKVLSDGEVASSNSLSSNTAENDITHARYPNLVLANKHISTTRTVVKHECQQLVEACDKIKLWINLTMPRIEDGDNFGVQVQEEVLAELNRAQESSLNLRDSGRQNLLKRAKICSKMIKYPHVEDYALALQEHDESELYLARQHLFDIRNIYAVLTDMIHKNIAKESHAKIDSLQNFNASPSIDSRTKRQQWRKSLLKMADGTCFAISNNEPASCVLDRDCFLPSFLDIAED